MAYNEAIEHLPADAEWSCSFGNPGEGGFVEYYRTPSGEKWVIFNGPYDIFRLDWGCQRA